MASDGDKNFLDQLEKVYSSNGDYYLHIDKEASMQVVQSESGAVKFSRAKPKDRGVPPFVLELNQEGNMSIRDNKDEAVFSTDTRNRGISPYTLVVTDEGRLLLTDSTNEEIWKTPISA